MKELKAILTEAIGKLEKKTKETDDMHFQAFDMVYNLALKDVVSMVINKLPEK